MFQDLTVFQKVYETRSITKAAKDLYVTQPSISIQIKKLEAHLGVKLFERSGNKGVVPTENANRFYRDSQIILQNWENSLNHLVKSHRSPRIRCAIGVSPTTSLFVLPKLMENLQNYFDQFDFEIITADSEVILEDILKHEIAFGILEKPFVAQQVEQMAFTSDELVLAGNLESPEWIIGRAGSTQREYTERYFNEHHIRPTHLIKVSDDNLITKLVSMRIGKAIVSKRSITDTLLPYQQLSSDFRREFYLLSPTISSSTEIQKLINRIKTLLPQFHY
ncbi:LysR family transcriptional regulator [Lapidilactobacillus salsurivasis]